MHTHAHTYYHYPTTHHWALMVTALRFRVRTRLRRAVQCVMMYVLFVAGGVDEGLKSYNVHWLCVSCQKDAHIHIQHIYMHTHSRTHVQRSLSVSFALSLTHTHTHTQTHMWPK